jgi:glycosyltransferase involved in cell wall biosynthesis
VVPAVADPLVTAVTPTWGRHELLLNRAVPSVAMQDYPALEHVVVSDGPDPALRAELADQPRSWRIEHYPGLRFEELPEHPPAAQWGHYARLHGIDLAKGEYIACLDDDNSWHSYHVRLLVRALEESGADFAYPRMAVHGRGEYVIGTDPPAEGQIDTSMIVHRRELLDVATWRWYPGIKTIDWDLVERWMAAGATWTHVNAVTCDYYFHCPVRARGVAPGGCTPYAWRR